MCEAAAQLCSYYIGNVLGPEIFLGFGGMQDVKFRRPVVPGERFVLVGKIVTLRKRRSILATQGFVDGKLVFEGTIIGMPV
jgi:3-hydroxyacyl-[acyl-carrier-protein] dehydratase